MRHGVTLRGTRVRAVAPNRHDVTVSFEMSPEHESSP